MRFLGLSDIGDVINLNVFFWQLIASDTFDLKKREREREEERKKLTCEQST